MFGWYLKISRPRFWLYLFGPFLIGVLSADPNIITWAILLLGFYFTFPANLLIYGVNDLFDYETDKHNPKKQAYEALVTPEKRRGLLTLIALTNLPVLILLPWLPTTTVLALIGFWVLGIFYSAPPIRAKIRPLIDTLFNALYIMPGIIGYSLITQNFPPVLIIVAATFWCMAMHAYSAVPDIAADSKAKICTIATWLGARSTLLFSLICYALSAILTIQYLGLFSIIAGAAYVGMMLLSLRDPNRERVFRLYKNFPYINMVVGGLLFFWVALVAR